MNAQELRIGNWVSDKGKHKQVTSYDIVAMDKYGYEFAPIPLTPEILEMAGFVENSEIVGAPSLPMKYTDYRLSNGTGHYVASIISKGVEIEFAPASFMTIEDRRYITILTHLHQLQNVIFALTETELNIQL